MSWRLRLGASAHASIKYQTQLRSTELVTQSRALSVSRRRMRARALTWLTTTRALLVSDPTNAATCVVTRVLLVNYPIKPTTTQQTQLLVLWPRPNLFREIKICDSNYDKSTWNPKGGGQPTLNLKICTTFGYVVWLCPFEFGTRVSLSHR